MRYAIALLLSTFIAGCATTQDPRPREFLDEQTAATITISSEPVIFVSQSSGPRRPSRPGRDEGFDQEVSRDYVELYGIDVNRMGKHQQYFVVQRWLTSKDASAEPVVELSVDGQTLELRGALSDPAKLGISSLPAKSFSRSSQWWYFPTDTATLRRVAAASHLQATLVEAEQRLAYELFSDGRAQLGELAAAVP